MESTQFIMVIYKDRCGEQWCITLTNLSWINTWQMEKFEIIQIHIIEHAYCCEFSLGNTYDCDINIPEIKAIWWKMTFFFIKKIY